MKILRAHLQGKCVGSTPSSEGASGVYNRIAAGGGILEVRRMEF